MEWKLGARRRLSIKKRDIYGIDLRDTTRLKMLVNNLKTIKAIEEESIERVANLKALVLLQMLQILMTDNNVGGIERPIKKVKLFSLEDFDRNGFSELFRFRSPQDIRLLIQLLEIPAHVCTRKRYRFSGEEVVLISLIRLAYPLRWRDVMAYFPGRERWQLQSAFYWFLEYMIRNWGYLVSNNRLFWLPYLGKSAEAIRKKLASLPNAASRQYHPSATVDGGFSIFGFIDNTIVAMCRPGGGGGDGEQAPRVPRDIQQAWWTGWKKLHGIKWQTVVLANGMDFDIYGPVSTRHPDSYTLRMSRIEEKLANLQSGEQFKFKIYGDSAYQNSDYIVSGGGIGMSSVRETIEWSYKDLKTYWKICDYRHVLKLRQQPVAKIVFVCLLLKNMHACMYGNENADYFIEITPSIELYLSQGPSANPLPRDLIFSDEYEYHDEYELL